MSYTQLPEEWIAKNIHNPQTNNRDKFLEESTHYFFFYNYYLSQWKELKQCHSLRKSMQNTELEDRRIDFSPLAFDKNYQKSVLE